MRNLSKRGAGYILQGLGDIPKLQSSQFWGAKEIDQNLIRVSHE